MTKELAEMPAKLEAVKKILNTYFEDNPWTGEPNPEYDDMVTAQEAIDQIVEVLRNERFCRNPECEG